MKIDVPYNLLILSAFASILKYEDKHELEIEKIDSYIEALLNEVRGEYEEESVLFNAPIDKWQGQVEFIKNNNYLAIFLQKYAKFFTKKNDKIMASLALDYEDIYQLMNQEQQKNKISNRFLCPSESLLLLQKLGLTKIINQVKGLINVEKKIEKLYFMDNVAEEKIAKYSLLRILFLNNLTQKGDSKLNAYLSVASQIMEIEEDNMDFMPVDTNNFASSPYYNILSEEQLGNYLNKAIFGMFPLYLEKSVMMIEDSINYHLLKIVETDSDAEDEVMEATSLLETDELNFSFIYLAKLRRFRETYGEIKELVDVENRLLYILDNPNMELFDRELTLDYIAYYEEEKIEDLSCIYNYAFEVYLQCEEIFASVVTSDNIKKVLFIATYYELTHDKKVEELIDKHYLDSKYASFCQIIFGDIRSSFLNLEGMQ